MQAAAGTIPWEYTGTEIQTCLYTYSNPKPICGPAHRDRYAFLSIPLCRQLSRLSSSPLFSLLLSPLFRWKILTPYRIRCVSIMWDTRSQTVSSPLGNSGMGAMKQGLVYPFLPSFPKVSRCWDMEKEDQRKEGDKFWQMERKRHLVQRYQSHWDSTVSTLPVMNSETTLVCATLPISN